MYIPCFPSRIGSMGIGKDIKDCLTGFFFYGAIEEIYSKKRTLDNVFMLGLFGNMIGCPYLFNYYHLRLMPYYVNRLDPWKRRVLKERDFFDQIKHD